MRNYKKTIQLVGLLILIFFTVEYLEPSAVGVRIGHTSATDQSSTKEKSSTTEKTDSPAPHAMIWSFLILLKKNSSQYKFQCLPESLFIKHFSKEIFHPPLLSI